MSDIHLIDGEKGGIGKSMFAKTLSEYCLSQSVSFDLIDADRTNPDVGKVYGSKLNNQERTFFSELEEHDKKTDIIFERALEQMVIVNLPAQIFPVVTDWIERNELLELSDQCGVQFYKWFICTGETDSINLFLESLKHFENQIPHILVRNLGASGSLWNKEESANFETLDKVIRRYNISVIDLPKLPALECDYIKNSQCTFAQASKNLKMMSKQRIAIYLKKTYAAIASTGIIKTQHPEVQSA